MANERHAERSNVRDGNDPEKDSNGSRQSRAHEEASESLRSAAAGGRVHRRHPEGVRSRNSDRNGDLPAFELVGGGAPDARPDHELSSQAEAAAAAPTRNETAETIGSIFKTIDLDGDGDLTKDEIDRAVINPEIKGDEAAAIATLKRNFEEVQNLDNSLWEKITGSRSLTSDDLDQLSRLEEKAREHSLVRDYFEDNFDAIDSDGDGNVTVSELNSHKDLSNDSGADLVIDTITSEALSILNGGSLSRDYFYNNQQSDPELKLGVRVNIIRDKSERLINAAATELFNNTPGGDRIVPDAVNQNQVGDCPLMSTLVSMACSPEGRARIERMIKTNDDGTYTVTFANGASETVQPLTDAELALYCNGKQYGSWAAIVEKAYGQWSDRNRTDWEKIIPQEGADGLEVTAPLRDGKPEHILETMIGKSGWLATDGISDDDLRNFLLDTNHRLSSIAATGRRLDNLTDEDRLTYPGIEHLSGLHVYAVMGYDCDTDTVTIRNPHEGGVEIKIPFHTFKRAFLGIASG